MRWFKHCLWANWVCRLRLWRWLGSSKHTGIPIKHLSKHHAFLYGVETTNLEKAYLTPANQGMHSSEEVFSAKWSRISLTWTLEGVVAMQSC